MTGSSFEESRMQESNNPRKAVIYTLFMQGNDMIYSSSVSWIPYLCMEMI